MSGRKNITQPADWWAAFEAQASKDGQTLAAWLGDCGRANLAKDVAAGLSERPSVGAPKKPKSEQT